MKKKGLILVCFCILILECKNSRPQELNTSINSTQFKELLNKVSTGWNNNNARAAANCFSEDAVYIEPPNQQLYQGRKELFEFFGGSEGRSSPMKMSWHYIMFDKEEQVGSGEYTFEYRGRLSHGMVVVQISQGKIRRWREYQYRSNSEWPDFIGKSAF